MKMLRLISSLLLLLSLAACGDDSGTSSDTGVTDSATGDSATADTGAVDSGSSDSGSSDSGSSDSGSSDSGSADTGTADSGASDSGASDSGSADTGTSDSGAADSGRTDGGLMCEGYGAACSSGCVTGLSCVAGVTCLPTGTETCGGFAGATCPTGKDCLYITGTDVGACLEPNVVTCVCSSPGASAFTCPGRL